MSSLETIDLPAIAVLGAGSMGRAILGGLRAPHVRTGGIRVTGRDAAKLADLRADAELTVFSTVEDSAANQVAVRGAGIVIVAVKPAGVPALLSEIAEDLADGAIVVSVAAGVTLATMQARVPAGVSVIRSLPNTPAAIGRGVTGLAAGESASDAQLASVVALFSTVGEVLVVSENKLDALGTVSGSGPAYVFLLIEAFIGAAIEQGFTAREARLLVQETFAGASELLALTGEDPAELRRRVTSPNGTTERAIAVLQASDLEQLFVAATTAALARSHELAAEAAAAG